MTTEQNDFWGDEAGWSTAPERDHTTEVPLTQGDPSARGIGSKASRLWGSLLSSGSKATRAHGGSDAAPADNDFETRATPKIEDKSNDTTEEWDDGWEVEPTPVRSGGVDPLLAKFGGAAVVLTLLIPLAVGLRSGSDEQLLEAAATAESSAATSTNETSAEEVVATTIAAVETATGPQSSNTSNDTNTTAPSTEAASEDSASSTSDSRSVAELTDSADTADSSSNIAVAAEAEAPAVRVEPECPVEYEVVVGDFWIRIANGAGVSISDLLELNGARSATPLYPGSSICLPAGASTPPPPPSPVATEPATTTPATTAAPTTVAPTTAAPPPPAPTAPEDIEQIIRDVWPDELEEHALEVAWRESNYIPTAKNYCCYGLFQMYWDVHKGWLGDMGITSATQLYDPTTNARAAYALYQRAGGWGPWGG